MRLNLSNAVSTWSERYPDKMAIDGDYSATYRQLDYMANYVANSIATVAPSGKHKIAILEMNGLLFVTALLGINRSGNIYVLLNQTLDEACLADLAESVGCTYYLASAEHAMGKVKWIPISENNYSEQYLSLKEQGVLDDAAVFFSSGTTGKPKPLLRSNYSVLSEIIQWIIELELTRSSTFLVPRPLYYTGGFVLLYATLFVGGCVSLLRDYSINSVVRFFSNNTCDWSLLVPSVIRELLSQSDAKHVSRNVLTMGDRILPEEKQMFQQKYQCNLIEVWGNTEGLGTITCPEDVMNNPTSVGRAFFTDFIEVDHTELRKFGLEQEGILRGKSDNIFSEYIGNDKLTAKTIVDGWIVSEDVGRKDEYGLVYLTGRLSDAVLIEGRYVFLQRIEEILRRNLDVVDAAVFLKLEQDWKYTISAAVVSKKPLPLLKEQMKVNSELLSSEQIQHVFQLPEIPRNHGGKVEISKLLALIEDEEKKCVTY